MLFLLEKHGPIVAGLLFIITNQIWLRISVIDAEWGNRMLDRVIQASVVCVAFWGIAITLLLGMDTKPIIGRLKRLNYYRTIVHYFEESLFASLSLLFMTILLEPASKKLSAVAVSAVWIGVGIWALLTAVRTYAVLGGLLVHSSED